VKCECHGISMCNTLLNNFLLSKCFVISVSGFDQICCKQRRHNLNYMVEFRTHIFLFFVLKIIFFFS
jgi:hypothetical protein